MTFDNYLNKYIVQNRYVWPDPFNKYLDAIEDVVDINTKLTEVEGFDRLYKDFKSKTKYTGTIQEFEFELERSNDFKQVIFYGV